MGVNRKFDLRRVWKFCWDLSNVISGGNWLFRWDCIFSVGLCTPLRTKDSVEMPCMFIGESSSQHGTTLKSLVTIGILIVKRKNASSKTILINTYTVTEKLSLLDNQSLGEKKCRNLKNAHFEKKCPNIRKTFFPLWLPPITLLLN